MHELVAWWKVRDWCDEFFTQTTHEKNITPKNKSVPVRQVSFASVFSISTLLLMLANLVPVARAYYLGWDLTSVLLIYWSGSAVIGFYNFCKIFVIGGESSFRKENGPPQYDSLPGKSTMQTNAPNFLPLISFYKFPSAKGMRSLHGIAA